MRKYTLKVEVETEALERCEIKQMVNDFLDNSGNIKKSNVTVVKEDDYLVFPKYIWLQFYSSESPESEKDWFASCHINNTKELEENFDEYVIAGAKRVEIETKYEKIYEGQILKEEAVKAIAVYFDLEV